MLRGLIHRWRLNAAVALGAAVATAVLTGALLVGDSVRGSLREMTLGRLGAIDHAVVTGGFVRDGLADDVAAQPGFDGTFERAAPAIVLRGAVLDDELPAENELDLESAMVL